MKSFINWLKSLFKKKSKETINIAKTAVKTPTPTCPRGYAWNGTTCVPDLG